MALSVWVFFKNTIFDLPPPNLLDYLLKSKILIPEIQILINVPSEIRVYRCEQILDINKRTGAFILYSRVPPIPVGLAQNFTNQSCLVCIKSENYVLGVTLRTLHRAHTVKLLGNCGLRGTADITWRSRALNNQS